MSQATGVELPWVPLPWHMSHRIGGVDGHLLGHAGRAFGQVKAHAQQRVRARPDPADRAAGCGSTAEERLENVAEATESAEAVARSGRVLQRVTAEVDDAPFLRVAQYLIRGADLLELGLGPFVGVDVGVQFPGQLAIGALDLRIARALAHPEQPVIIACHA